MRLFRTEALRNQDTLHGEVNLAPPVGWQVVGGFLLAAVVAAGVFLSLAEYGRVTVLKGVVATDLGLVRLAPARAGVFDSVSVREGQAVRAGQVLAHVAVDTSDRGGSVQVRRAEALEAQAGALSDRLESVRAGARERTAGLQSQVEDDERQIRGIEEQIAIQGPLIRAAEDDLADVKPLQQQGLLSRRDFRLREEQVAERRQGLVRLQQELSGRRSAVQVARAEIARVGADAQGQESQVAASRAELARSRAGEDLLSGFDVRAPVAGVVAAVRVHPGDLAAPGAPAMTLVPAGGTTEAVFTAPASAGGLLDPGQPVRIAVDAYPFATFGALPGKVLSVARATGPGDGGPDAAPAGALPGVPSDGFRVRASLPPDIWAYGARRPLRPGATLTARVRTQPRTLLAWLFDPVLAVARR